MPHLFPPESVSMGHPDKVADQISDAILDAMLDADPFSRVAVETMVSTGMCVVAGEVTTRGYVEIADIVRKTIEDIGYTDGDMPFDAKSCAVLVPINRQRRDIPRGVARAGARDLAGAPLHQHPPAEEVAHRGAQPGIARHPTPGPDDDGRGERHHLPEDENRDQVAGEDHPDGTAGVDQGGGQFAPLFLVQRLEPAPQGHDGEPGAEHPRQRVRLPRLRPALPQRCPAPVAAGGAGIAALLAPAAVAAAAARDDVTASSAHAWYATRSPVSHHLHPFGHGWGAVGSVIIAYVLWQVGRLPP